MVYFKVLQKFFFLIYPLIFNSPRCTRCSKGGKVTALSTLSVAEEGLEAHFLHCQLQKKVWKHSNVLKDSLDLIRELETASFSAVSEPRLTTADVVALYPSIRLERGMVAG